MNIRKTIVIVLISILFLMSVYFVHSTLVPTSAEMAAGETRAARLFGWDWRHVFRPAILNMLHGGSPYSIQYFYSPPWVSLILLPLAFAPVGVGMAVLYVLNIFCFVFVAAKFKMNLLALAAFFLFSGMIAGSYNANIEGIVLLGALMPPSFGLFFLLLKPQFALGIAIFIIAETVRVFGWIRLVLVVTPVSLAFLLSFMLYGCWPLQSSLDVIDQWWNASIFPYGLPLGILSLGWSLWKRDIRFAMLSSPFFSPYLTGHTWSIVWFGFLLFVPGGHSHANAN